MVGRFGTGTINVTTPSAAGGQLGVQLVAIRNDDDLVIEVTSTATGYNMEIVLRGSALAAAISADDTANYQLGHRKLLARYDRQADTLETHPLTLTVASPYFLRPKYEQITSIKFEGYGELDDGQGNYDLEALTMPSGFVKDIFAGFGALYELHFIIDELERQCGFTALVLSEYMHSRADGTICHLTYKSFDKWRRAVRRGHLRAVRFGNSAKRNYLRKELAGEFGFTHLVSPLGPNPADLAESVLDTLNLPGRQPPLAAATNVVRNVRTDRETAKVNETELLALSHEIELLAIEDLIERLEVHIAKKHDEAFWQKFLSDNPFIIRLAFGLPIAIFGEQLAVGGMRFDGSGGKIADYLLRVGAQGNMAIIEIKKPDTELVNNREYRGGVFAPHKDLTGAVTQVLDQRYQLQMDINNKKVASAQFDVFTYAMQCLVIAGRELDDLGHRKSFELFRNGLKDVTVITFSELLLKLKALHAFLTQDAGANQAGALRQT